MRMKYNIFEHIIHLLIVLFFISLFFWVPAIRTDPVGAQRTLIAQGYTGITVGGFGWFQGDDWYSTKFKAISPNGTPVSGVVTSGLIAKGHTVRLD